MSSRPVLFVLEIAESRRRVRSAVFAGEITDRRAFARRDGRAVTGVEEEGKAAAEIRALWDWLKEQMQ